MLKFWLSFATFNAGQGRLFTWALTISRHTAIDYLREARYRAAKATSSFFEQDFPHLTASATFRSEHTGVRDWLNVLPVSDHQLMAILYLQGYTHTEAADVLQLPLGTVKTRAARIVRTLARVMKGKTSNRSAPSYCLPQPASSAYNGGSRATKSYNKAISSGHPWDCWGKILAGRAFPYQGILGHLFTSYTSVYILLRPAVTLYTDADHSPAIPSGRVVDLVSISSSRMRLKSS